MTPEIEKFWDLYEEDGIQAAVDFAKEQTDGSPEAMAEAAPYLVAEGKKREIDILEFLEKLDEVEQQYANGTDNDARGVSPDSDSQADKSEDEDESAPASDADGEDRSEDESSQ